MSGVAPPAPTTAQPHSDGGPPMVEIPAHLLQLVLADARCQRDRARGESALAAALGSTEAKVGDAMEAIWAAMNPGVAALLAWAGTADPH